MGGKPSKNPGRKNMNLFMKNIMKNMKPGDNSRFIAFALALQNLPPVDLTSLPEVEQRVNDFFKIHAEFDMKPTINGLAVALKIDRRRLWEYQASGKRSNYNVPDDVRDYIRLVYTTMAQLWESFLQEGKINPVSGIFLGKNHFGYSDGAEFRENSIRVDVVHHSLEEIQSKYITGKLEVTDGGEVVDADDFDEED